MRKAGDFHKQDEGGEIHGSGNLNFPTLLNVFLHLLYTLPLFKSLQYLFDQTFAIGKYDIFHNVWDAFLPK